MSAAYTHDTENYISGQFRIFKCNETLRENRGFSPVTALCHTPLNLMK